MPNKTNREPESTESQLQRLVGAQAEELRALELLLSKFVSWDDLEKLPSGDITRATFLEMAQMAEAAPDEYQPQVGHYLATALDVEVTASANDVTSIEVLFSTGGPGIWLECDSPSVVRLQGAWWGEADVIELELPALARALSDLASAS